MIPLHNYHNSINQTAAWDLSDSKELYQKNISKSATRQKMVDAGYFDIDIEYKFNSHGFRTHEVDTPADILCFGCSYTMGTGVHNYETWPAQLEALTGLSCINLGHAGCSNDTAFRMAEHYLKLMKPKYAVWLQTDRYRFELFDENVVLALMAGLEEHACSDDYFIRWWFLNSENSRVNHQKNTLAFQMLCHLENVTPVILEIDTMPVVDHARDLMHPGRLSYQKLAQTIAGRMSQADQE
tara:strand:- start:3415 stop:4134 length:720 start_codon:yes stop_codon:yes gene_type:complete